MKKKILIVTNLYPTVRKPQWGTFVYEQVMALKENHSDLYEVDVYHIDGSTSKWSYLKAMFFLPFQIYKRYHVVHVHYGLTLISLVFSPSPVVVTFHGSDLLKKPVKYISKLLNLKATKSIVVSKELRRILGQGEIIPCGINIEEFKIPSQATNKNGGRLKKTIRVLFPSNPKIIVKNYPLFKKVCNHLALKGYTIEEIYLMNIPRDKVPKTYWNCDVMLLTSFSEGSPTVIKEAIASKLPFVSVNVGDVKEWANLIDFGVVSESREPEGLATDLIGLLDKIKDRKVLDNTKALKKMDNKAIASLLSQLYTKI